MTYHENISFKYCQAKCDKMELENFIIFLNSFKKTPSCYFSKLGIWRPNLKKGLKRILYYSMRIWKKYDRYMVFFPKAIIRECCTNYSNERYSYLRKAKLMKRKLNWNDCLIFTELSCFWCSASVDSDIKRVRYSFS